MTTIVVLASLVALLWIAAAVLWVADQPGPAATVDALLLSVDRDEQVAAAPVLVKTAA